LGIRGSGTDAEAELVVDAIDEELLGEVAGVVEEGEREKAAGGGRGFEQAVGGEVGL